MYWPLLICIQKILDLGWEVFIIGGTFFKSGEGIIRDYQEPSEAG